MSIPVIPLIIAFLGRCLLLLLGFHCINIPRQISPDEGIEDSQVVQAYDKVSQLLPFKLIRRIIISELRKYDPHGILVDIGCGPGYLLGNMARSFKHLNLIGVDISEEMVRMAASNLASKGLNKRVGFRVGDIQELPFNESSVDFILSTLSLHHWLEPKQALQEIERVLRPGGQFLIFDLRRDSPRLIYWLIRFAQTVILPSSMKRINEPTSSFLASYTPLELKSLMSELDFTERNIKPCLFWVYVWGRKG